ncbi:MAG TPA: RNA polymerase alpha subunit C-terminal domain-containing protein [Flavobacteriales bacterium]|nr:RNA polymerase alpha subunit C-terminal domain-containing protein [Flavobacteriales bacterium]HRE97192.1 RNA polymerase alpha subunit C-terminal domain-containing protein [Flavobacteriales bacterium]HRJ38685.1 RNA polymerase alpha subunit C-terminal domain-containing protein [Flavobacteriales bacterium]
MATKKNEKTCENGHTFHKSSDCPVCPICEAIRKPQDHFLSLIAAPARRALERENIKTLKDLSQYTEKELLALHGMGKSTLPKLKQLLEQAGLSFKW